MIRAWLVVVLCLVVGGVAWAQKDRMLSDKAAIVRLAPHRVHRTMGMCVLEDAFEQIAKTGEYGGVKAIAADHDEPEIECSVTISTDHTSDPVVGDKLSFHVHHTTRAGAASDRRFVVVIATLWIPPKGIAINPPGGMAGCSASAHGFLAMSDTTYESAKPQLVGGSTITTRERGEHGCVVVAQAYSVTGRPLTEEMKPTLLQVKSAWVYVGE